MPPRNGSILLSCGNDRFLLSAQAQFIGTDILVSIFGGTRPHIGSVVVSTPRKSLKYPEKTSATSSIINITGHKDEAIARMFSEKIAAAFSCTTVAVAGFHVDNLSPGEIDTVLSYAGTLCLQTIDSLKGKIC